MRATIIQPLNFDGRCLCFCISNSFTTSSLSFTPFSHHSLSRGSSNCQIWGRKEISLRKVWSNKRLFPTRCSGNGNSSSTDALEQSSTQAKAPFGYTRKDVLLIGLGVTVFGVALKSGLEFVGVDPLQAGNVVQLVIVLGMTVGWISTYMFRVANKDMTYAQQLRDYESKVMEKRLEGLTEAELQVLLEQVEEEKKRVPNSEQVN